MGQDIDAIKQSLTNYTILHLIAQSQTADVYLGEHTFLQTQVAVKLYHQPLSIEETASFEERIQIIAKLHHPHIVRLLEYTLLTDRPCLVTDFAVHGTLRDRYPQGTQLTLSDIMHHVEQIASALQYIHEQNMVHGDLKPENLLLNEHDKTLLNDFDLLPPTTQHQSEEITGTIQYMAPEQLNGYLYPASDQYALAIMIWEWLTGTPPFQGTHTEIAAQHIQSMPSSLHSKRADISPAIEDVLRIALAKKPDKRFSSVAVFAKAFIRECKAALADTSQASLPTPDASSPLSSPVRQTEVSTAQEVVLTPTILPLSVEAPTQQADMSLPTTDQVAYDSTVLSSDQPPTRRRLLLAGLALGGGTLAFGGGLALLRWQTSPSRNISQVRQNLPTPTPVAPGTLLYTYTPQGNVDIGGLLWSSDGKSLAINIDGSTYLWPIGHGTKTVKLVGSQNLGLQNFGLLVPQWSPDSKLLVSWKADQPIVIVWDAHTGQIKAQWKIPSIDAISDVAWLSSNKWIRLIAYNRDTAGNILQASLQRWDTTTQSITQSSDFSTSLEPYLSTSPNALYALNFIQSSFGEPIAIVSVQTGKTLATIESPGGNISDIGWSGNSNLFAIMVSHVYVYDTQTGKTISQSEDQGNVFNAHMHLSPDGKYVAFTNGKIVVVSSAITGKTVLRYYGHTSPVSRVAWSPDGKYLSTACYPATLDNTHPDKTVQVWRAIQ